MNVEKYNDPLYMDKTDLLYRVTATEDPNEIWSKLMIARKENGIKLLR